MSIDIGSEPPLENNEDSYDDLMVSIEANQQRLNLLIAVCDYSQYREQIIQRYEQELAPNIRCYRVTLARGEPSLRAALAQLVGQEPYLQQGGEAVVTVTGIEQLYVIKQEGGRSEQEIFFGYLQWTREALREFPFSIVLWVTNQIERNLSKQAPDFWSWRKGVFRFQRKLTTAVAYRELQPFQDILKQQFPDADEDDQYFLPIQDLQALIQEIEQEKGKNDPSLAILYQRLGQIYQRRCEQAEFVNYQLEQDLAIEYFKKAIELQQQLSPNLDMATNCNALAELYCYEGRYREAEPLCLQSLELRKKLLGDQHLDFATSLHNLARIYSSQGRYSEAEPLYLQSLELRKKLLGDQHRDVATILNNLANLYYYQGRYSEAEPLYLQSLELRKKLFGDQYFEVANSLVTLAELYSSQGRYSEAEPLYLQFLEMRKKLFGDEHPAVASSLNTLANLYASQGRYSEAELLYLQSLEMRKKLLGDQYLNVTTSLNDLAGFHHSQERYNEHRDVDTSLNNLANLYYYQGRYSEAETLYLQSLELMKKLFGDEHSAVVSSLNNLANLYYYQGRYSEAEPLYLQSLELTKKLFGYKHVDVATSLNNLANLYSSQGRYSEAEPLYLQALEICKHQLSIEHPNTQILQNNWEQCRAKVQSLNELSG